jgi:hypothetical protein
MYGSFLGKADIVMDVIPPRPQSEDFKEINCHAIGSTPVGSNLVSRLDGGHSNVQE